MTNMNDDKARRLHYIYSILLSVCIVIAGLCLILACIGVYRSGEQPFSREAVADAFSDISIPVYLCLIMTIIGIILDVFFSTKIAKEKPTPSYEHMLNNMYNKRDINNWDDNLISQVKDLKHKRKLIRIINIAITLLCSVVFLIYALNDKHFHQTDINGSMIKAMCILVPCLIVSFGCTIFTLYYSEKSIRAELALIKQAPVVNNVPTNNMAASHTDKTFIVKYVVLIASVILLIYGFSTGGTADVLTKAINICTECIGLG